MTRNTSTGFFSLFAKVILWSAERLLDALKDVLDAGRHWGLGGRY